MFKVTNRSGGYVVYNIPEMNNLRREYAPGETKAISEEELNALNYIPGGRVLLYHFLMVDKDALEKIEMQPEPEYFMDEVQVENLLKNGSLDEFLDALDFAPAGVLELIKDLSVRLPLNDVEKRRAILEKTGFDVDKAVHNSGTADDEEKEKAPTRRVQPQNKEDAPQRRTGQQKFNIGK